MTTTTTTAFAAAVSAAAAAAFLRDAFVAAETARAEAGYTFTAEAAAEAARVTALTEIFEAITARGLRERPARRALHAAIEAAGVHVGYASPRVVARPFALKRGDVIAALKFGWDCPCTSCGGEWRGECEAEPATWAYRRQRMRAARRAALASLLASLAVSL
jgi:hypothetical protein